MKIMHDAMISLLRCPYCQPRESDDWEKIAALELILGAFYEGSGSMAAWIDGHGESKNAMRLCGVALWRP
jgi:hypothetical protein